jgi:hypothetical protein
MTHSKPKPSALEIQMRLYIKLFLMVLVFLFAAQLRFRDATSGIAYDIQFGLVWRFGTPAEYQAFVDATNLKMAEEVGTVDMYVRDKQCTRLIEKRIAAATARVKRPLTQDELETINIECQQAVFVPSRKLDEMDAGRLPETGKRDGPGHHPAR